MKRTKQSLALFIGLLALGWPTLPAAITHAQQAAPAIAQIIDKLPSALRAQGAALLNEKDNQKRSDLAEDLAEKHPAEAREFLLALMERDPAAVVRETLIDEMGDDPHPQVRQALAQVAATDADVKIALLALERLRAQQTRELRRLLAQRLEVARQNNDTTTWRTLAQEDERWIALVNGTMLPAFLRTTPPVFALKAADKTVRVLTLGDFGYGAPGDRRRAGEGQKQVAAAMQRAHKQQSFDFGLTLGDNFYPDGMESPADARWQTLWREQYEALGLQFYATLGNHDWHHADSPAAEILYAQQSATWRLPAPYYTFTAGPVQFFALDTNEVSALQLHWLQESLTASRARWKVVYGHHPIYSAGRHADNQKLIDHLLPVLRARADLYLAGHDHDLQHLKPEGGLHFFINGGGGAGIRKIVPGPRSLFAHSAYSFGTLEADAKKLTVKFIGADLKTLYEYTLTKPDAPAGASQPAAKQK